MEISSAVESLGCDKVLLHKTDHALDASHYTKWMVLMVVGTVLVISGTVGNILSFIVLQSYVFRKLASSYILSALALVDTGVLLTGLLRHCILAFSGGTVDIRSYSSASCKIHTFLTFCLMQISAWTLVLVTTARLISAVVPYKAHIICSRRNVLLALSIVIAVLVLLNSHMFFTMDVTRNCFVLPDGNVTAVEQCLPKQQHTTLWNSVWPWVDSIVCSLLPGGIILGENIAIATRVWVAKRTRRANLTINRQQSSNLSVTTMLVGISVLFIVTNIPTVVYFFQFEVARRSFTSATVIFHACAIVTLYCNHAFNFVIYSVFGRAHFWREVMALLACKLTRDRKRLQSMTMTTLVSNRTRDRSRSPRAGSMDHLAGDKSPRAGSLVHLAGDRSPRNGSLDHLAGDRSPRNGSLDHLAGDRSPRNGSLDHLAGDRSPRNGSLDHLAGDRSARNGSLDHLAGERSPRNGSLDHLAGSQ